MMRRHAATLLLLFLIPVTVNAQSGGFEWFPGGTYDSQVPHPAAFLGYEIGSEHTWHNRLQSYMEAVAEASDRVTLTTYGKSYEGRDLMLLFISSPANHARLDEIQGNMAALADPRGRSNTELEAVTQQSPAVAWLSYNVHGNESAGTEAAILTVYQLAAGTDALTRTILDELVVVIDPLQNPDGRDLYVANFKQRRGRAADASPDAWEHSGGGGRSNHYQFDLNRDWVWQTQIETQQRLKAYLEWNPVVHVDFHEMGGDSYFFFPAATPVHEGYPDVIAKWQRIYGEGNAAAFDQYGWPYYTKVGFDMYYPSYGDSWPSLMGAIGMTYEQGGGGGVGIAREQEDGTVHTLKQRTHGHFTTSMATLKTTAERRAEQLTDFLAFFREAIALGDEGIRSYALVPATDPYFADRLVDLLRLQGIEVGRADAAFRARIAEGFGLSPAPSTRDFAAGTYLVPAGQPKGVALRILMERMPALEDTSFYDLSGWSVPLLYNVEAYALSESPGVATTPVTDTPVAPGGTVGSAEAYAWAIPYDGPSALFAANELLNRGLRVHSASEKFTAGGRTYPAGSFVIPRYRNPVGTIDMLEQAGTTWGVTARPLATGLVEDGIDLGGGAYRELKKPRIAVAAGSGARGFSAAWHFFDQRYPWFDYSLIDSARLPRTDLSDYDVLVLGGASAASIFGDNIDRLQTWLQDGGVLLAWGSGASSLGQEGAGLVSVSTRSERDEEDQPEDEPAVVARTTIAERRQQSKESRTPGGIYGIVLDPDHWLAFGLSERMAVMRTGRTSFSLTTRGVNVGVFMPESLLSGYAPPEVEEELSKRAWLIEEGVGQGKIVLFADDPLFRMFAEGQHHLVLNALILGPGY